MTLFLRKITETLRIHASVFKRFSPNFWTRETITDTDCYQANSHYSRPMKTMRLAFCLFATAVCSAQDVLVPPRVVWEISYGNSDLADTLVTGIEVRPSGRFSIDVWERLHSAPHSDAGPRAKVYFNRDGRLIHKRPLRSLPDLILTNVSYGSQPMPSGGYLLSGTYYQPNLGNPNPFAGEDYFVSLVNRKWQPIWTHVYGGEGQDRSTRAMITRDGGILLSGNSYSPTSGNKTSQWYGEGDFWLVRLDKAGRELWQNSYGGAREDRLNRVIELADGGFLLAGWSTSPPSESKTSPFFGGDWVGDYWVVRIDTNGGKIWERSFGGSAHDWCSGAMVTKDGGFLLTGHSGSPADGNKTSPAFGGNDIWLVRLNAVGDKLWDRTLGFTNFNDSLSHVSERDDGGFIIGGWGYGGGHNEPITHVGSALWRLNADGEIVWSNVLFPGQPISISLEPVGDDSFIAILSNYTGDFSEVRIAKLTSELPDADMDGVPDKFDECPNTPAGSKVNRKGCRIR